MHEKEKAVKSIFEDTALTMMKFPEVELAETKRVVFNLVNMKEIELLTRIHMLYPHQYQHTPSPPVQQINYFSNVSFSL
jgi:hypothetical protein